MSPGGSTDGRGSAGRIGVGAASVSPARMLWLSACCHVRCEATKSRTDLPRDRTRNFEVTIDVIAAGPLPPVRCSVARARRGRGGLSRAPRRPGASAERGRSGKTRCVRLRREPYTAYAYTIVTANIFFICRSGSRSTDTARSTPPGRQGAARAFGDGRRRAPRSRVGMHPSVGRESPHLFALALALRARVAGGRRGATPRRRHVRRAALSRPAGRRSDCCAAARASP